MKKVLLIAPQWMGLHRDIIQGLLDLGFDVYFVPEIASRFDPYNVRATFPIPKCIYNIYLKLRWKYILRNNSYFDYLFVIDGQGVIPELFQILLKSNPKITLVNYLFDTIRGVYEFNRLFQYYHSIYTFDSKDAAIYNLTYLPIYWVESKETINENYSIFGFGAFNKYRYDVYERIYSIASTHNIQCFIKLYYPKINKSLHKIKAKIKRVFRFNNYHIPLSIYSSELIVNFTMSSEEFRKYIMSSQIILDTNPIHQDGLTARFMWALGAKKKIITSNASIANYSFYDPEQILIYDHDISDEQILAFVNSRYSHNPHIISQVNEYRIDKWLRTILNLAK